ncbi:hypothetical protein DVJ78_01340 [Humibacter sp. BT305]|nr:hypothetical protein DVJ78_01340 [Humibacter sp. BT305]
MALGRSRAGIHLATFGRSGVDAIDIDPDFPLHSHDALFRRSSATAIGRLLDHYRYPETALAGVSSSPDGAGLVRDAAGYVAVQLGELREGYGCLALPLFVDDATLPSAALAFTASVARVQDAVEDLSDLRDRARLLERLL